MKFKTKTPRQALNKAYIRQPLERIAFQTFEEQLRTLFHVIDEAEQAGETEEHYKGDLKEFLQKTHFGNNYYINTKGDIDLAIHPESKTEPVGVLLELKRPSNKSGMISAEKPNAKALHEAVLYYLRERLEQENSDLKQVVITNLKEWFFIDGQEFERHFFRDKQYRELYKDWKSDQKVSGSTDFFYTKVSEMIKASDADIAATYLKLDDYREQVFKDKRTEEDEKALIPLYKVLSSVHLLKEPFANDSNSLDKQFYNELLHIIGLEEVKEGSQKIIRRVDKKSRNYGSLIENTIANLQAANSLSMVNEPQVRYGNNEEEQYYNLALELCILWINRILFLKLMEAQLFRYHKKDERYKFLNFKEVDEFDELNKLFFRVLARQEEDRHETVQEHYFHIPYLNSSLFEPQELEKRTIQISNLDDHSNLPIYGRSVLKDGQGKPLKDSKDKLNTLQYLFRFLDAYDFSAEGKAEIQDDHKTLINASVLGLIFEKINGYKDGSFYTPGFVTEYMCRETLRKAVVEKFREYLALSHSTSVLLPRGGRMSEGQDEGETRSMSGAEYGTRLPESLIANARQLRKNQTESESILWELLRNRQLNNAKFRRQHPIKEGILLDFYCHEAKLAIEVDGGYHEKEEQKQRDEDRTEYLNSIDIRVIRFTNDEVLEETERVLEEIALALTSGSSPAGGRGVSRKGRGEGELTFSDLYNYIGPGRPVSIKQANELVNSIKVCDPAVGSGHFLVSALNELIAIKSDLGIFCDEEYKVFRYVNIEVENDELVVTHGDDELFEYEVGHKWKDHRVERSVNRETQRLQQALFHEKKQLIENNLFGVDINPNSVKICRLRLWIELLKHAYYKPSSPAGGRGAGGEGGYQHLQVLPNIDINIKQGNSLVSRFALDTDLEQILKETDYTLADYREAVQSYKETRDYKAKQELRSLILEMKEAFTVGLEQLHPERRKLKELEAKLIREETQQDMFGDDDEHGGSREVRLKELQKKAANQQQAVDELESGAFFNDAFEWRFEFPEALDGEGRFTGFDVVMGNPPYVRQEQLKELKDYLKEHFAVYQGTADLYQYFIEQGMKLLKEEGLFHYIVSNKWMRANYGKPLREWLQNYQIESIIDFGDLPVFEEATTYPCLLQIQKLEYKKNFEALEVEDLDFEDLGKITQEAAFEVDQSKLINDGWTLINEDAQRLVEQIREKGTPLGEYVNHNIYYGIKTGLNKAFVIDEETKEELINKDSNSSELINPFLAGRDIKRYQLPSSNKYLILIPSGWTDKQTSSENKWEWFESNYPALAEHLSSFKEKAQKRYDQGNHWWELRPCDYYEEFKKPKILFPDISKEGDFTFDDSGNYYMVNTAYFIPKDDLFLLALLGSNLIEFYYRGILASYRGGYLRFFTQYLEQIPVVVAANKEKKKIESLVNQILTSKKEDPDADTAELEAEIDRLVYKLYGLSEEEIAIAEESVGN